MPRIFPEASDLTISPDGAWAAALNGTSLRLYDLVSSARASRIEVEPAEKRESAFVTTSEPTTKAERPSANGRIVFLDVERLLHIFIDPATEDEPAIITAELLGIPNLKPVGPLARVAGAQRIIGVGPAGAVVAPNGPGADILHLQNGELVLQRTFLRGEVLSAISAPERRFLLEQRSGFDLWDPATRGALARLILQTRQQTLQVGYAHNGRMLWALSAGPPVHVEIFRASDGRRALELDQPGRGLGADVGTGRLVLAVEERLGPVFLDLDLTGGTLTRLPLPKVSGKLHSFAVRSSPSTPEVLALTEAGSALLRINLPRLQSSIADENTRNRGANRKPHSESAETAASRTAKLRQQRPESRMVRRPAPAPTVETPVRARPQTKESHGVAKEPPPVAYLEDPLESEFEGEEAAPPPVSITLGEAAEPRGDFEDRGHERRLRSVLSRAYDPAQSPAAWQWELLRWAQLALLDGETGLDHHPPEGGPLAKLGTRLRLSPAAAKILGLLYAGEQLLGARPKGMRPLEIAACLGSLYEEPVVLGELMPSAPLRSLGLLGLRSDGRLRVFREAAALLEDRSPPELLPPTGSDREPLVSGLYVHPGPLRRNVTLMLRQPLLRVDALAVPDGELAKTVERAQKRALLHDAVVLLDGVAGLSYPVVLSTGPSPLPALRALLLAPRVPVILCAMADAVPALGLSGRPLPAGSLSTAAAGPAPLYPSAPLPLGVSWRSPISPASAAFLPSDAARGRLEPVEPGDRRAAAIVGVHAAPDACAQAAYLAARDGAILHANLELSGFRSMLLAMLLQKLPLIVSASPPASPSGNPAWPKELSPFLQ